MAGTFEIKIDPPQKLAMTDTFSIWRDKINCGMEYSEKIVDAINEQNNNIEETLMENIKALHDRIEYDVLAAIIALG